MRNAALLLLTGLWAAAAPSPAPRGGVDLERHNTLAEMMAREILPAEAADWKPEDMSLLVAMRNAESAGAIALLRRRQGRLDKLAVPFKPGSGGAIWRLTKEGFGRYRLLKSQDARAFFEQKGMETKQVFFLRDQTGRRLFEDDGLLTGDGSALFESARRGVKVFWLLPSGELRGTGRPPAAP